MANTETAGYEFTMANAGSITLGSSTFRVEVQTYSNGNSTTWLHGARGAVYFLRPYLCRKGDDGVRQIISWKSGAPYRQRGNEIRVVAIGDQIEVAK